MPVNISCLLRSALVAPVLLVAPIATAKSVSVVNAVNMVKAGANKPANKVTTSGSTLTQRPVTTSPVIVKPNGTAVSSAGLTKTGAGTLQLASGSTNAYSGRASNTSSGSLTINGGALYMAAATVALNTVMNTATAVATRTGNETIPSSGGTSSSSNSTSAGPLDTSGLVKSGSGTLVFNNGGSSSSSSSSSSSTGSTGTTGTATLQLPGGTIGNANAAVIGTLVLTQQSSSALVVNSSSSGTPTFTKTGTGTFTLNSPIILPGNLTLNAGTIILANSLKVNSVSFGGTAAIEFSNAASTAEPLDIAGGVSNTDPGSAFASGNVADILTPAGAAFPDGTDIHVINATATGAVLTITNHSGASLVIKASTTITGGITISRP